MSVSLTFLITVIVLIFGFISGLTAYIILKKKQIIKNRSVQNRYRGPS